MGIFVCGEKPATEEQGFAQFHEKVELEDCLERYRAMLEWAYGNPGVPVFVSPSAAGPELQEALRDFDAPPENMRLPGFVWRKTGTLPRVFLNLGDWSRYGVDAEAVARHLPRLADTPLVCRPEDAPVADILMEMGSGEMSCQVVYPEAAFDEKYRGHAGLARNWFACWNADSILSWDQPRGFSPTYRGSLNHLAALKLAEFFRLPTLQ